MSHSETMTITLDNEENDTFIRNDTPCRAFTTFLRDLHIEWKEGMGGILLMEAWT